MRYARACATGVITLVVAVGPLAHADGPAPVAAPAQPGTTPSPATPAGKTAGVAVLARRGAEVTAAWALAQEIYAQADLRPASLDEARARVLVGQPPAADAPRGTKDLADERDAVHGDDGASRALLASIASQLGVGALLVVETGPTDGPVARLFFADTQSYDAARYAPDAEPAVVAIDAGATTTIATVAASDGGTMDASSPNAQSPATAPPPTPFHWSATVTSVQRIMWAPIMLHAPVLATSPTPPEKPKERESHPFYTSPWFWGAVGAAAFGGTAVYFATRDNSASTIHLDLQVPK